MLSMQRSSRLFISLFILSVATLTLEVLQLRIFAYSLLRSLAHIVVSIVLMGIGIGSISMALISRFNTMKEEKLLAYLFLGFSVSVMATHFIFSHYFEWINAGYNFSRLWLFSIIFSVPYIFFGAVVTYMFKKNVSDVPKLYSVNLIGSGLGCIVPLIALRPLGAENLILLVAFLGAFSSLLYVRSTSRYFSLSSAAFMLFIIASFFFAGSLFDFKSKTNGGLSKMKNASIATREFSRWDPLGKIEVYSFDEDYSYMYMPEAVPIKAMFQDGDAGSMLLNVRRDQFDYTNFFDGSIFSLVYQLRENPETLAIGLGGGHDIMRASYFKSRTITGVEINSTTVNLVKETFKDFLGDPYNRKNISIVNMDGRYFVKNKYSIYDIIQIAGADTDTSNLTSGALSVSENYLYTSQAFKDYFNALKPDGVLSLIRFGSREPMLIIATALKAMEETGIVNPYNHFIVVKQAINVNVLIKKVPFLPEEMAIVKSFTRRVNKSSRLLRLPVNDVIGYEAINDSEIMYLPVNSWNNDNTYTDFMESARLSQSASYIKNYPSNISPLTDNKPFFFQYEKPENIFKYKNSVIYNLFISIMQIFIFTVLIIFLPVYILKRKETRMKYNVHFILFFFSIGIGFMLLEIGLIQKSVLFLGHPTYSFVAVVFSMLLFSGLGSLASGYLKKDNKVLILVSLSAIVLMTILSLFFMENILNTILPENMFMRMIIISLFISPLAFAMGIPLPKGIQLVSGKDSNFIPVAMAANSVASVLAAASSLPFAMILPRYFLRQYQRTRWDLLPLP